MNFSNSSNPRYELKFIAEPTEYFRVLNWLRQHQSCLKTEYPDRQINNIYFDSYHRHSYCDNIYGASSKSKIRFRWYGNAKEPKNGFLEIKCKRNQLNWKKIYKINGNLDNKISWRDIVSEIRNQLPSEGKKWLEMNPLPILMNRYRRKYFVSHGKKVRVTLDSDLIVFDQSKKPFANYSLKSNLPQVIVLEINRDGQMYGILRKEIATELVPKLYSVAFSDGLPPRAAEYAEAIIGTLESFEVS